MYYWLVLYRNEFIHDLNNHTVPNTEVRVAECLWYKTEDQRRTLWPGFDQNVTLSRKKFKMLSSVVIFKCFNL